MVGEIYLGKTSPKYVLPETWNWFAQDMQQAQPKAYVRPKETLLSVQTPFAQYVSERFINVYDGNSMEVSLDHNSWSALVAQPSQAMDIAEDKIFSETSPFVLSNTNCVRISGTLNSSDSNEESSIIFNVSDPTASYENVHLSLSSTRAASSSDNVEFASKDLEPNNSSSLDFLVIVGSHSAVLVVNGKVVAGTRTGDQAQLSVALKSGQPSLSNLRIDTAPQLDGCSNS